MDTILDTLTQEFGVRNLSEVARRKLDNFIQTSTVAAYTLDFFKLVRQVKDNPLSDGEKFYRFRKGLSNSIKNQLSLNPSTQEDWQPSDLLTYIKAATNIDVSRTTHHEPAVAHNPKTSTKMVKRKFKGNFVANAGRRQAQSPRPPAPANGNRSSGSKRRHASKEFSSEKKKRISDEEWTTLKKENRCFLCKEAGHVAKDCPNRLRRPSKGKKSENGRA
jgi:Zinc knuckle